MEKKPLIQKREDALAQIALRKQVQRMLAGGLKQEMQEAKQFKAMLLFRQ